MLLGVISGDVAGEISKAADEAKKVIVDAVKVETKTFVTDVFIQAVEDTLNDPNVAATGESIDAVIRTIKNVKDVYQKETLDSIYTKASEYVTKTFKENVFNYEEMIEKVKKTDF